MSATVDTVYGIPPATSDEENSEEERLDKVRTEARTCAGLTSATLLILLLMALHLNAHNAEPARLLESRRSEMSLLAISASQASIRSSLDSGSSWFVDNLQKSAHESSFDQQQEKARQARGHLSVKHSQTLAAAATPPDGSRLALNGRSLALEVDSALSDSVAALPRNVRPERADPRGCGAAGPCHTGLDRLADLLVPVDSGTEGGRGASVEAPQHQALAAAAFAPGGAHLHLQGSSLAGELQGVLSDNVAVLQRRHQTDGVAGCAETGSCDDDVLVPVAGAGAGARRVR